MLVANAVSLCRSDNDGADVGLKNQGCSGATQLQKYRHEFLLGNLSLLQITPVKQRISALSSPLAVPPLPPSLPSLSLSLSCSCNFNDPCCVPAKVSSTSQSINPPCCSVHFQTPSTYASAPSAQCGVEGRRDGRTEGEREGVAAPSRTCYPPPTLKVTLLTPRRHH